jgi:hypothetical protein
MSFIPRFIPALCNARPWLGAMATALLLGATALPAQA